jgi:hypothetical protein
MKVEKKLKSKSKLQQSHNKIPPPRSNYLNFNTCNSKALTNFSLRASQKINN